MRKASKRAHRTGVAGDRRRRPGWKCRASTSLGRPPEIQHGGQLPAVRRRSVPRRLGPPRTPRSSCVIFSTTSQSSFARFPRTYLRTPSPRSVWTPGARPALSSRKRGFSLPLIFVFGNKTLQNCIISNPLNLSPAMSPLRHRSVFGAKSAENGELRKVRFSCPASNVLPGPPNSLVFPENRLQMFAVLRNPFSTPKACEFQPTELVTADVTGL